MDTTYQQRIPKENGSRETTNDLKNEQYLKLLLEKKWNCSLIKQAPLDPVDFYALKNNQTVAWLEMRTRKCLSTTYSELFMGKEKFLKIRNAARSLEIPCFFIVKFDDGVFKIDLTLLERPKETWGSRGEVTVPRHTDNERVILIPIRFMKQIIF